jgi:Fe-S oxidoreductase
MFIEMRREAARRNKNILKNYSGLMAYEKVGTSKRYSWYSLPEGCDSVFFPGCTLSGTRPDTTFKLYQHLKKAISNIGIVLDCCTKPSHDLGRKEYFEAMLGEMKAWLMEKGIKHIYAACPNCYRVFKDYAQEFFIHSVYEHMAQKGTPAAINVSGSVTIHDPCVIRNENEIQGSVRTLLKQTGLDITEMSHSGIRTVCCGEGGTVRNKSPELAQNWISIRKNESKDHRVITYCAGCAGRLSGAMPAGHILDLMFDPDAAMSGKEKVSRSPFTYWNRLRLKKKLKKEGDIKISRERDYSF